LKNFCKKEEEVEPMGNFSGRGRRGVSPVKASRVSRASRGGRAGKAPVISTQQSIASAFARQGQTQLNASRARPPINYASSDSD